MLYAFPVGLIAIAFGLRAGVRAGLVAVALIVVWVVVDDVSLSLAGWVSRVVSILLLGLLLGDASDRLRRSDAENRRLEAAALLYREAIEINDSVVQGMAAAQWRWRRAVRTSACELSSTRSPRRRTWCRA